VIAVFLGPTLAKAAAADELDALYLPPAAQGDVYRAVRHGATAIGIVDGLFGQVPSVWHKEVLWALSENVPVYGSASMGALRAAELSTYGMVGVGAIFEAYRDAAISDDDEVAQAHLGAADGYRPTSVPMVDIRATLEVAEAAGVIGGATLDVLVAVGKALWYPDRTYPALICGARGRCDAGELDAFSGWWSAGQVSRKREDALAMLRRMRADAADGMSPSGPSFWFERTALFDELMRTVGALDFGGVPTRAAAARERADFLGKDAVGSARDAALARVLALEEARRLRYEVNDQRLYEAVAGLRANHGLVEPDDVEAWMRAHDLDAGRFVRLAADEARIAWVHGVLEAEVDAMMPDHLRVTNQFKRGGAE
jgi:hypothetical protein